MKKRIVIGTAALGCVFVMGASRASAQDALRNDDLFAGVEKFSKGSSNSSEVNLDKNMLGFAGGDMARKMDFVYVRTYEYPAAGAYKMSDVEDFQKRLDASGCKHMVKERSAEESSDICVRVDNEGHWREMVVISAEPKELSFVHLKGQISMQDLSKLGELGSGGMPPAAPVDPKLQHR
jgi:hypothetical protein